MKRIVALGLSLLTSTCGNEPASEPGAPPTFEGTASSGERIDFLDKSAIGHPPADPPPWITNLAVVDLDQDGLLDVVLCDATRNQVAWIRQAPLGTFTESVLSALVIGPAHVTPSDVDQDGDIDLLIAEMGQIHPSNAKIGTVSLLEQREAGAFGTCQQRDTRKLHLVSLDYGGETREVGAIDVNNQDLVA